MSIPAPMLDAVVAVNFRARVPVPGSGNGAAPWGKVLICLVLTNDQIAYPVSGHGAVLDLGEAFTNRHHARNPAPTLVIGLFALGGGLVLSGIVSCR